VPFVATFAARDEEEDVGLGGIIHNGGCPEVG
jgi:hypothetical protein